MAFGGGGERLGKTAAERDGEIVFAKASGPSDTGKGETGKGVVDTIPNDETTTFTIALGQDVTGTISPSLDGDFFRVELQEGQTYVFTMTGSGASPLIDPFLALYSAHGLVQTDDDSGGNHNAQITFTASFTGTYYIQARAFSDETGGYTLSLDRPIDIDPLRSLDWGTKLTPAQVSGDNVVYVYFGAEAEVIDEKIGTAWTTAQTAQAMLALQQYSNVVDLTFVQTTNKAQAHFTLVKSAESLSVEGLGYFYPPGDDGAGIGWFNTTPGSGFDTLGMAKGGLGFVTLIHEFGHGLGLAHPHDTGGASSVMLGVTGPFNSYGVYGLNQGIWTTMTYNDGWASIAPPIDDNSGYQATPMAFDIALLQQKYGVNTTFANGDNVYQLSPVNGVGVFFSCIWDTGGVDEIRGDGGDVAMTIDLRAATLRYEVGGAGFVSHISGIRGGYTIANGVVIENATGGAGHDNLIGNAVANVLRGNGNGDRLEGGGGADVLDGGAGLDWVEYETAQSGVGIRLNENRGLGGDAEGDVYISIENAVGSAFADTIAGTSGANQLYGWTGDDFISALSGDDRLMGDLGNDILRGGAGNDYIHGGGDVDTATYSAATSGIAIDLRKTFAQNTLAEGTDTLIDIENVIGSAFNDVINGNFLDNVLTGGDGADMLYGEAGRDTLEGGAGNDVLEGHNETDILRGGAGVDWLKGQNEDDVLEGGDGADTLSGGSGHDVADYTSSSAAVTVRLFNGTGAGGHAVGDSYHSIEGLTGSAFADALVGSENVANRIRGGAGNDSTFGLSGDDSLFGDAGNDKLDGGAGADTLEGGAGRDTLIGGDGVDWASYAASTVAVTVRLWNGTGVGGDAAGDSYSGIEGLIGSALHDSLLGADRVNNVIRGGAGNDGLYGLGGDDALWGEAGHDKLDGALGDDTLDGGDGDDTLIGGDGADTLQGGAGRDTVSGGLGNDTLAGGAGNDTLRGEDGDDLFLAKTEGVDLFDGGAGNDTISYVNADGLVRVVLGEQSHLPHTLVGIENVIGSAYTDIVEGDGADNRLSGNGSGDHLYGAGGSDILSGGDDGDRLDGGAGADILDGGVGVDVISFVDATAGVVVRLWNGTGAGGDAQGDTYISIEDVYGTNFADTVVGTDGVGNVLLGYEGNDSLYGLGGDDILNGAEGNDRMDGGAGDDIIEDTGAGNDTFVGGDGDDYLSDLWGGNNSFDGGAGDDQIFAGEGRDRLIGGEGDDILLGGGGADVLDGGAGIDTVHYQGGSAGVVIRLWAGKGEGGQAQGDTLVGIENVAGSSSNDSIVGSEGIGNALSGENGNDSLYGLSGNDVLTGGQGNDRLDGGDGDDMLSDIAGVNTINGGAGVDTLVLTGAYGRQTVNLALGRYELIWPYATSGTLVSVENVDAGADFAELTGSDGANRFFTSSGQGVLLASGGGGDDILIGGNFADNLEGGTGADTIDGGEGVDTVLYSGSASGVTVRLSDGFTAGGDAAGDTITNVEAIVGSNFADVLTGDNANNWLHGAGGNDTLSGLDGEDSLDGQAGDDTLSGGAGNDDLSGADGADVLDGGAGEDYLIGGTGADVFVFSAALGAANADHIRDLEADDRIHLDADVFLGMSLGALAASAFVVGPAALDADDRIIMTSAGFMRELYFDIDGSGAAAAVLFANVDTRFSIEPTAAMFLIV